MLKAEKFNVQNDIRLVFESEGLSYDMKLLIEEGLIILTDNKGKEQIIFLGEKEEYRGEPVEVKQEVTEDLSLVEEKPKKRRSKKKK